VKAWPTRLVDDPDDPDGWPLTLDEAVHDELVHLWGDLCQATREAAGGCWSIQCENITYRIVALSRFAGALPWEEVNVDLVWSGLYERVHDEAGLAYPPVDRMALAEHLAYCNNTNRPKG
jgi:hypothetical protein